MKVFFGCKGSSYYIMCKDFNEVYSFDTFGNMLSDKGGVSSCDNWQEVDIVSLVGVGSGSCEILCNDVKAVLTDPIMSNVATLRKMGGYLGTIFNVPHLDDKGKFNQILFVFKKGDMPKEKISKIFPNRVWNRLF